MKTYLDALRRELERRHLKQNDIDDIIADHTEMIQTAISEGLSESEIKAKFGDPSHVAADLADFSEPNEAQVASTEGYSVWKSFAVTDREIAIVVNLVSEDIIYQTSTAAELQIMATKKVNLDDYTAVLEQGQLTIKAPKERGFVFLRRDRLEPSFIVSIPNNLEIQKIQHTSVNSDIHFIRVRAGGVELHTTNGDIKIESSSFQKTKWNTVNGDILIENASLQSLHSVSVSGDVRFSDVRVAADLRFDTVSGDIELVKTECVDAELSSVSGDLSGRDFYPKRVSLKSVSGDIVIKNTMPTDIDVLRQSSVSGDIRIGR
ncbi:MAG: DUF4097 family beta strand repeat-containing protein [Bacillus subtilis]|nr:DUF4097 family beta strand repeat-containing protein [Bacillus subtilis]